MPSSTVRSYWAAILSVSYLFRDVGNRQLTDDPAPRECYLWTFTFADPEARSDPSLALTRWERLRKWLKVSGKVCVRSIEQGELGGGWHFHAVTPQFWDARQVWDAAARHDFGRVDVKRIPLDKAYYVAKYIRKRLKLPPGTRRWACVGFSGVTSARVKIREKVLHVVTEECNTFYDVSQWMLCDNFVSTRKHRVIPEGQDVIYKTMEIKKAAQEMIINALHQGKLVAVGEYRGTQVRTVSVEDYKTKQRKDKTVVSHSIEFGGSSVKCEEWLPEGSDSAKVKPPAQKGELVLCEIESASRKFGYSVTSIRTLASLV